jgi:iron complex transport system permease protein
VSLPTDELVVAEPAASPAVTPVTPRPAGLSKTWLIGGLAAVVFAALVALAFGPASLPVHRVALEVLDHVPGVSVDSGLTPLEANIVWHIRLPRVVLGLLVGGMLCLSGASYQGVFRNPLVDPYLLGVAAGAGLGATLALVSGVGDGSGAFDAIPVAAFAGGLVAVSATYMIAGTAGQRGTAGLLLAGIAMASFFTALQTFVQQRESETLREVYSWILGSLTTAGWGEVLVLLPYTVVTTVGLLWLAPMLDVMAVGDDEAATLGIRPDRIRLAVLTLASLAAAAAVAVSGLIGFIGLVVPHAVRTMTGTSNRSVLPLSLLFGAAFLALTDLLARSAADPAELPIGVVTAFIGAPFFLWMLRTRSIA